MSNKNQAIGVHATGKNIIIASSSDAIISYQAPKLMTHEDWVNGAWHKALFGAPPPANPVRNTSRPNDWKSQSFGRLALL